MPEKKPRKTVIVKRKGEYVIIDHAVYRYNRKKRRERKEARRRSTVPQEES